MIVAALVGAVLLGQAGPQAGGQTKTQAQAGPALPVLTIKETLQQAEKNNNDLKVAQARLQQVRQNVAKAWSYYLPQVTASGSYTHNPTGIDLDFNGLFNGFVQAEQAQGVNLAGVPAGTFPVATIQKQNQVGAQIQVNQAIFAPALFFAIRSAYAGTDVAELTTENARRQILFAAAQAYYGATSLKQAVSVQERQLAVTRDHERDARVRYQAGTTPKVALLRAEIDRATAEQGLLRAQNSYASAKVAIATLIGRSGDFDVEVPAEPALPSQDLPALEKMALQDRPDVKAAASSVTLAERTRSGSYMGYLPTLGAFGRYSWANVGGFSGTDTTWVLGLALNWNLFDGFLREATIRENNAKVAEAEANQAGTHARALQEVEQALLDYQSAQANKVISQERASLARENAKLIDVNFRAGAATYLEVADAQSALLQAELGLVGETLNTQLAALRLLQAAGAFNPK